MKNQAHPMKIAHISAGATPYRNDDHVAVFDHAGATDILVIDGGTSVAGRDYLDPAQGDVAWFVHAFTVALAQELAPGRSQQECVHAAVDAVRARFEQMPGQSAMPLHAWPIAAMTWLRVGEQDGIRRAALYSLGDCKTLVHAAAGGTVDLDPYVNPQDAVLQTEIAKLRAAGVTDPEQRRERMLPMLRARREFQNTQAAPTVLCLRPIGALQARVRTVDLAPGSSLLIMTDGFYRLVDHYERYTNAALVQASLERGLPAMLDELRTHEAVAGGNGARAVKAADDASAALWTA